MQKVWEELKSIEAQAEQIQANAQEQAKKITSQAKKDADTLLANSRTYAAEESQKLYTQAIQEANQNRQKQLDQNVLSSHKLRAQAEKRMDKAVSAVVDAVLKEA